MPYPLCTLCQQEMEESFTITKERKREQDGMLPYRAPVPRRRWNKNSEEDRIGRNRAVGPAKVVYIIGACGECCMRIAGFIESLRQPIG